MSEFLSFLSVPSEPRLLVAAAMLLVGAAFGALAESSQFCLLGGFRDAAQGQGRSRLSAFAAGALAAVAVTQALVGLGHLDLTASLYLSAIASPAAVAIGGFLFGLGAALTRGCAGRLTILTATGNLRALIVILVVAIAGYATMRGLLAPVRTEIEAFARPAAAQGDLATSIGLGSGARLALALAAGAGALALARMAGLYRGLAALAIGALIAGSWAASASLGDDGFDKLAPWSPSFISPLSGGLIYVLTYTGARLDAGVAFLAGVLIGAFVSALAGKRAALVSFESPRQTLRYLSGGLLMGFGGVMAIGCSTGQGLSGLSTLAPASFVAIAAISAGMWAGVALDERAGAAGAKATAGATV
ncbi:MAG: YeeE/YedE family protein [Beijerinckiaceae bacterium]|nr:YeeE/YedE family protein [Beijerinckiaceae bacterium]